MAYRLLMGATAAAALIAGTATADDNWGRHGRGWDSGWRGHGARHHYRHHDDNDDAALLIGGAIVGLAIGSILSESNSRSSSYSSYAEPSYAYDYGYAQPAPSYGYVEPSYSYATPAPQATYAAATPCRQVRSGRTATGAIIGGVVGGLLGNGVAADKNRDEGTAVGAALGSVIGGSIGNQSADCAAAAPAGYYQTGYSPDPAYSSGPYSGGLESYPSEPSSSWENELYGGPEDSSSYSGPAAEECQSVMRVTALPDGREIHEPVEVCREAYYGDWDVRD